MSSPLVIATGTVTGQIVNSAGVAISGLPVTAKLNAGISTPQSIAPAGQVVPVDVATFTDTNGFWQLNLVPNSNINPANTTYTISVPGMPDVPIQLNDTNSHPYLSLAVGPAGATLQAIAQTIPGALTVQGLLTAAAQIVDSALAAGQVIFPVTGGQLSGDPGLFWDNANKRLGVGTAAPSQPLHVVGSELISNGLTVSAGGVTVSAGGLTITGTVTINGHWVSNGPGGVGSSAGANAGTTPPAPVVAAAASDVRGNVTFGTGTAPAAGAMVNISFGTSFAAAPLAVILTWTNAAGAGLGTAYATNITTTGFTINCTVAPAASQGNTTYSVNWVVIG